MMHYWGAKAIVQRIGLRDARRVPYLIKRFGLPAFLRRDPQHLRNTYYSSEGLILAWELVRAKHYRETLLAKEEAREKAERQGTRTPTRTASTGAGCLRLTS
jgi:hypothetical protein